MASLSGLVKHCRRALPGLALAAFVFLPAHGAGLFPVNVDSATVISFTSPLVDVTLDIPQGAFQEAVTISISTAAPLPADRISLAVSDVCIDIRNDKGLQPLKELALTLNYLNSDVWYYLDEHRLSVARYDETAGRWVSLPSTPHPELGTVTAVINHLSKFTIAEALPAGDLRSVRAFPVPFSPVRHAGLTIENITAWSIIKIYDLSGELVREINETDSDGKVVWDGKNDAGRYAANGIYFVFVDGRNCFTKLKIAVER